MLFERALVAEGAIAVIANAHVDDVDEFSRWRFIRFEVATAIAPSNLPTYDPPGKSDAAASFRFSSFGNS